MYRTAKILEKKYFHVGLSFSLVGLEPLLWKKNTNMKSYPINQERPLMGFKRMQQKQMYYINIFNWIK